MNKVPFLGKIAALIAIKNPKVNIKFFPTRDCLGSEEKFFQKTFKFDCTIFPFFENSGRERGPSEITEQILAKKF